jgi:hypothetical protein
MVPKRIFEIGSFLYFLEIVMEKTSKKRLYCVFCVYIKTQRRDTRRIRELLDQKKGKIKLMWISSQSEITGKGEGR